jgi:effector-binding domain-containing protein
MVGFFIFLNAINVLAANPEKPIMISLSKTSGKGELRIVEGIPFLKVSGSYYEMGRQYGSLLKNQINEAFKSIKSQNWERMKQHQYIFLRLEKLLPSKYVQYLKGIAAGSGQDYHKLLIGAFTTVDDFSSLGCSSILTKMQNDKGVNTLFHAKNLDNFLWTGHNQAIIEFNPIREYKYIGTELIGAGISDGMNEKGISISIDDGGQGMRSKYPMNPLLNFKMRDILSSTKSLAEVDQQMNNYVCDIGQILIIGSSTENNGIVYDISYDKIRKNRMNAQKHLFVTNTYLNPDLTSPENLFNCPRYKIIDRYMKDNLVQNIDNFIELLSDPGTNYGVNNNNTKHSVIYDPQNKTIYMAFSDDYSAWGKWLKYDWVKDKITVYRKPLGLYGPVRLRKTTVSQAISIRSKILSYEAQTTLRDTLNNYILKHNLTMTESGYTIYHGSKGHTFDVEVVQPIAEKCNGTEQVKFRRLKPSEMVYIVQTGPYQTNRMSYFAMNRWLSINGYQVAGPYQECYIKGSWNEPDPRKWATEIRVPVKKKAGWFDFWPITRRQKG